MSLKMPDKTKMITVVGPTASGKTIFATSLALDIDGEIISADSRQVYRGMDIGTGKDLSEYKIGENKIPYHLIDILNPGDKYNLFDFQRDFHRAYNDIRERGKTPILCGGTGMYVESVLKGYKMLEVPENKELRADLEGKSKDELAEILKSYKNIHNKSDFDTSKRTIRAIEIADYQQNNSTDTQEFPPIDSLIFCLDINRETRREKISSRLRNRVEEGLIDEVKAIMSNGVTAEDLIYYGLEYKYVTLHVIGKLSFEEMINGLETAIHRFSKRQMTWFRGMERRGFNIRWIDALLPTNEKVEIAKKYIEHYNS